jgi:hypothetical protein
MIRIALLNILLLTLGPILRAQSVVTLDGHYQGKNIYIQNPRAGNDSGYCVQKVLLNGKEIEFENTSAFQIRLDSLRLAIGDSVYIQILHDGDCNPKVLHDTYTPKSVFELVSIRVDSGSVLRWQTKNEMHKLPFVVEIFRWNKWIKLGEVDALGGMQVNEYSFRFSAHAGENRLRVKQAGPTSRPNISRPAIFVSDTKKVGLQTKKIVSEIHFSEGTMYELFDKSGNIVKKGTAKTVDCRDLRKGRYFLNYDNTMEEIIKQ